jgi:hypothetical protein
VDVGTSRSYLNRNNLHVAQGPPFPSNSARMKLHDTYIHTYNWTQPPWPWNWAVPRTQPRTFQQRIEPEASLPPPRRSSTFSHPCTRPVQIIPLHTLSKIHFNIIQPHTSWSSSGLLPSVFTPTSYVHSSSTLFLLHVLSMLSPFTWLWFPLTNATGHEAPPPRYAALINVLLLQLSAVPIPSTASPCPHTPTANSSFSDETNYQANTEPQAKLYVCICEIWSYSTRDNKILHPPIEIWSYSTRDNKILHPSISF